MAGVRGSVGQAVKLGARAADVVRPPDRGVIVLIYHRVGGDSGLELDLPTATFERQMEVVAGRGAETLDAALNALSGTTAPATDPVVVTFDDGSADFVERALPVLERFRIPVVLYVATDFVERQQRFADGAPAASWTALADAVSTGLVTIGSHTHRHRLLDRLPPGDVDDELDRSLELIGERLGIAADHFAHPKAVTGSPAAEAAIRRRFRSAALAGTRPNRYGQTDPYRLSRSPIQLSDGMKWFERKLDGGLGLEDRLRTAANRWRYAGATA